MLTAVFIMQCVILLAILIVSGFFAIQKKQETQNIPDPRELNIFKEGLQRTWTIVSISLYKMWSELDILDFDSLQEKLQSTLNDLTSDQKLLAEWSKKFNEYMVEK